MNCQILRKKLFFRLASVALILGLVFTGFGLASDQDSDIKPRLRVLTYNIHHGEGMDGRFDYERLSKVIVDLKPDVVALQEVDCKTQRSGGVAQAELLGNLTEMEHVFGQAMPYQDGSYGEGVLSRFPVGKAENYPLPYRPGQEPRAALSVTVKPDNGLPEFIFVGTHLCHQSPETRAWQAQQINRIFPGDGGSPIILAGDLNARPGSEPMKELLSERWVDTVAPHSEIDYVLTRRSDPWRVVGVKIVEDLVVSDHKPVLVELEWVGNAIDGWALGTSEGRLGSLDKATLLELRDAGFDCVEIGMGRVRSADDLAVMQEQAKELNEFAEQTGVKIWSIHIPYGKEIDISLIDPVERNKAVAELKQMISLCEYLHPEKLVVHPSYELSRDIQQDEREKRLEACKESFNSLVKEAAKYDAKIAAECLPRTCLGNTSQEMNEILDAVESLEVCCDVNHLLQETTQDFIRRVGSRITTLHISDYDGKDERHWIPLDPRGVINWNEVLGSLVKIGYSGPFLFECAGTIQEKADCWKKLKDQYSSFLSDPGAFSNTKSLPRMYFSSHWNSLFLL